MNNRIKEEKDQGGNLRRQATMAFNTEKEESDGYVSFAQQFDYTDLTDEELEELENFYEEAVEKGVLGVLSYVDIKHK